MEFIVKVMTGESRTVHVSINATVGDLKRAAAQSFSEAASRVRLSTNNGQKLSLDDELKLLSSYGLSSGSTVMMLIRKTFQVFVKSLNGNSKTYDVTEEETVAELQQKIYNKERVAISEQKLAHNSVPLEPSRKLKDYDIQHGSTVHLSLRLRGG